MFPWANVKGPSKKEGLKSGPGMRIGRGVLMLGKFELIGSIAWQSAEQMQYGQSS